MGFKSVGFCLKGHTIEICSFYADRSSDSIIASGSFDTNVKLWDLRLKNCLHTLKNHNKKVSALCISPDSRMLVTGGEDGMAFAWDIRMCRPIYQYEICSPVLSIDVNASGLVAVGCLDRAARIYDLNAPFNQIGKTKSDTMPVTSCFFYRDNHLFTAGTDNLKVWDLDSHEIIMTDNIETSSKGILSMVVDDKVSQIAFSSGVLTYHECILSEVNFEGQYVYVPQNNSIFNNNDAPSPSLREVMSRKGENKANTLPRRGNSIQNHIQSPSEFITNERSKRLIGKRSDAIARELAGVHGNIHDALDNINMATESMNQRKNNLMDMQEMMTDDHSKFIKVMGLRSKSIQGILNLWVKGNVKPIINSFKTLDLYAASDVLSQILKPSNVQISTEFGLVIADRAKEMIKSKHMSLIKNGLEYMLHIVGLFKEEMVRLKTFGMDRGVDLAREERIRRFDSLIEQYVEVYQSNRLKKLSEKHDETSNLATQLSSELAIIFKKVFGPEHNF